MTIEELIEASVAHHVAGRYEEALAALDEAVPKDLEFPGLLYRWQLTKLFVADWAGYDEIVGRAVERLPRDPEVPSLSTLVLPLSPQQQREALAAFTAKHHPAVEGGGVSGPKEGKIRIGYFTTDFFEHATMMLLGGTLVSHDRSRFEIVAFHWGPTDGITDAVKAVVDRFVSLHGVDDAKGAEIARAANLDVAIDLKGHTAGGRLGLFARRVAPVQIAWLGWPGTTAVPYMDYAIVDAVTVPKEGQNGFSEKLLYLPRCYQPNGRRPPMPIEFPRVSQGLPEKSFVFCSFNQVWKIEPVMFSVWMRILKRVPGSVLWLNRPCPKAEANLRREAEARGVAGNRLVFAPWLPHDWHLARLRNADLALDTRLCNSHTTGSDALWSGVPLLTCPGQTFASRVGASLVTTAGRPDLIAESLEAYEEKAVALAATRTKLDLRNAPLFDAVGFTRDLERVFL